MDPFGHHHHHHHRRDDDREDEFPPPGRRYDEPPPPHVSHVYHASHEGGGSEPTYGRPDYPPPQMDNTYGRPDNYGRPNYGDPPPPRSDYYEGPPPPQPQTGYPSVEHVSHESESVRDDDRHHRFQPHVPSFFHHQTSSDPELMEKPSFRVYTKADTDYSLTIRDGKVVLASNDPSDPFQHWYKDERYSTKVKDEEGFPSFALVNKAAGLAIKHSIGAAHPVQLVPYDPNHLDASILWTESRDVGDGYRAIRMVNNINLNMDAWNADKAHGGVRDGTTVALWEWWKGDNRNQHWKIVPY
ncbi:ricin B-like lectin R40G3 [Lycium ferocissimum]|uniref:ricin B-like lectin R40G3 n=1 Tax=Lycium ferocissimum TaxID=112874 RepID=UPI00281644FB|nr:ricin B-like lectin R40G3 [Lycium ferocissimum]